MSSMGPSNTRGSRASADTVLLEAFDSFHAEVLRLKRRIVGVPQVQDPNAPPPPPGPRPYTGPAPEGVRQRLLDLVETQSVDAARKLADHEMRMYEEAKYVMVAMADEVFLNLAWPGRDGWMAKPLEAQVFRTHDAGERFFRKIDDILEGNASASIELCNVYLTALALGFRGKYRPFGPTEPEAYRRRLSRHIYRIDPESGIADKEICGDAHDFTLDKDQPTRLPGMRNGFLPLLGVFALLLVASELIWYVRTRDVDEQLKTIREGAAKIESAKELALKQAAKEGAR